MKKSGIAVLAAVLSAQPLLTTSASADGWRRGHSGGGWGHQRGYDGPRVYGHPYRYAPYHAPRRDRTGDAVGAAVLGIGALIVGAAIADAARRERRHYD